MDKARYAQLRKVARANIARKASQQKPVQPVTESVTEEFVTFDSSEALLEAIQKD